MNVVEVWSEYISILFIENHNSNYNIEQNLIDVHMYSSDSYCQQYFFDCANRKHSLTKKPQIAKIRELIGIPATKDNLCGHASISKASKSDTI